MLNPPTERLQVALAELLALESEIRRRVSTLRERTTTCAPAHDLLADIEDMACIHMEALRERLQGAPADPAEAGGNLTLGALTAGGLREQHPASAALRDAYAIVQEAAIGYSTIQPIATRARDSWVMANEGTTAHIARQHTQDYMAAAGRIIAVIHDVVVSELDVDNVVCRCTCPSCSIGVCIGAVASRGILAEPWVAARPPVAEHGVEVHPPRPGSAAAAAGLQTGDVIVAIDGKKVDSLPVLSRTVSDHEPGDLMELTVRRKASEVTILVEHRREGADLNEDECILPSGQQFYLDQARDVQQRLRERTNGEPANGAGLSSLSSREVQVLRLVALGATNPIIADELEISRATVAQHVANILNKLGLANRTQAASVAASNGLLPRS